MFHNTLVVVRVSESQQNQAKQQNTRRSGWGVRPRELVGHQPCSITLWWLIKYQEARKIKQNNKTPGGLDRCPTRGVGRTPTMFHNTLVVGSSPTSSTTQSYNARRKKAVDRSRLVQTGGPKAEAHPRRFQNAVISSSRAHRTARSAIYHRE